MLGPMPNDDALTPAATVILLRDGAPGLEVLMLRRNSKIDDRVSLSGRIGTLLDLYREPVLVEEFCSGPEYTVAILGTGASARVVAAMEIVPKKVAVADYLPHGSLRRHRAAGARQQRHR